MSSFGFEWKSFVPVSLLEFFMKELCTYNCVTYFFVQLDKNIVNVK